MSNGSRALLAALRNDPQQTVLKVPNDVSPATLAGVLSRNTCITQLILSGNRHYSVADLCLVLETLETSTSASSSDVASFIGADNKHLHAVKKADTTQRSSIAAPLPSPANCQLRLSCLDLSYMDLTEAYLFHVVDFVDHCPTLMRLDLSHSVVSAIIAHSLGRIVMSHPRLTSLLLDACQIGDDGLVSWVDGALEFEHQQTQRASPNRSVASLSKLTLAHNGLTSKGLARFVDFLERHCAAVVTSADICIRSGRDDGGAVAAAIVVPLVAFNCNGNHVEKALQLRIALLSERNSEALGFAAGASRPSTRALQSRQRARREASNVDRSTAPLPSPFLYVTMLFDCVSEVHTDPDTAFPAFSLVARSGTALS